MRKYENVDVTATLGAVMEINTKHYRSDFRYDKEIFRTAVTHVEWRGYSPAVFKVRIRNSKRLRAGKGV
jgi:hypothetical protein